MSFIIWAASHLKQKFIYGGVSFEKLYPKFIQPDNGSDNGQTCNSALKEVHHLLVAYSQVLHGEGNGTPLQYSCLENPLDGGAW